MSKQARDAEAIAKVMSTLTPKQQRRLINTVVDLANNLKVGGRKFARV